MRFSFLFMVLGSKVCPFLGHSLLDASVKRCIQADLRLFGLLLHSEIRPLSPPRASATKPVLI